MSITELSIKRPSFILVIFIVLTILGVFSYKQLAYELIPKFSAPFVIIQTVYPGANPSEVENSVTRNIEDAVSSMENIVSLRSTSFESLSFVFIELKDGTNIDLALQEAQRKINANARSLPENADPPSLTKFASDEFPILSIGVTTNANPAEFFDLVNDRFKPAISSVEGVGDVRIIGGQEREIQVLVNRQKLEARGMTILQVVQAIQKANLDFPTGKIENQDEQVIIRLAGKFQTVEDLQGLVVANSMLNGLPVKLSEVAEVTDGLKDITSLSRVDGNNAIGVQVLKTTDANAVAVAEGVIEQLNKLKEQYKDKQFNYEIANNQTDFTIEAVNAVSHDLLLAIVLVAVVMLFFLHSIRNAIIVMLAIPTSLVATFIMMYAAGFTLNLMTLLAMSLVIGILVDDSIVVLENIYRYMEHGVKRKRAALIGRNEIAFTALSITLVDVVVFVPIALTSGIVGNIMRSFALVVTFSTLMSLFVSFTLTPMLASRFSKLENFNNKTVWGMILNGFERILHNINEWYARMLGRVLNPIKIKYSPEKVRLAEAKTAADGKPRKTHYNLFLPSLAVFVLIIFLFVSSFGLISNGYIGTAFIQPGDRGEFIMKLELPKDATLHETNLATQKAEDFFKKKKEVTKVFSTIGKSSGMFGSQSTAYVAEMTMKLVPQDQRAGVTTDIYAQRVRNELERELSGVKVTTAPVSFFGGADEDPLQIFVAGSDKEQVMDYAKKLLAEIKKIQGTLEPKLSIEEGSPEIKVTVDRERMAQLGLTMDMVGGTMATAFNGNTDAQFRAGSKEYDINVKMDGFNRNSVDDIANLKLMNNQGQLIQLSQFANVEQTTGPNQLERLNRQPSVLIKSKVLGRPSGDIGTDINALIAGSMKPPSGITIMYEGDLKNQAEGFTSLLLALFAALTFVYLILVALYDSWSYPLVVGFSILPAISGAFLAMALTLSVIDIFSMLGLIMMLGLVAKNGILLVDFASHAKKDSGMTTIEALVAAGRTRLRPILMTTLSMSIGFLPIALAKGAGSEWKNGLAWALIGGLTSSMVLTLFIVPVMFQFIEGFRELIGRFKAFLGVKKAEDEPDWNKEITEKLISHDMETH
ncbi:MAG: efflux RND transporter permease subunit [Saprospiraceae bacterium]|nr:efflux RND transporter permease subunit [Saprospiraceae bacterium]